MHFTKSSIQTFFFVCFLSSWAHPSFVDSYALSFPHVDVFKLIYQFKKDKTSVEVPISDGRNVGYNLNYLWPIHHEIYRNIQTSASQEGPDRILEIGCGIGYTSCRLSLCGVQVDAYELSHLALEKAQDIAIQYADIPTSGRYKRYLVNFVCADVTAKRFSFEPEKYNTALIMNVFHFLTPSESIEVLKRVSSSLKNESSLVYITMNVAESSPYQPIREMYQYFKQEKHIFAGYLGFLRDSHFKQSNGEMIKQEVHHVSHADDIEVFQDIHPSSPITLYSSTKDGIISQTRAFKHFHGDTRSMRFMMNEAGLEIVQMYYQRNDLERFTEITPEILQESNEKGLILKLDVIAKKRPTP